MSKKKRKGKVALPKDRTGAPIHIGDVLEWGDGTRLRVTALEWYGGDFWVGIGVESLEGDESDNLQAGIVVGHVGKEPV